MPRPQRDLDPDGGPHAEFAEKLRGLRASVGNPKFETMARRAGRSKSTLAGAVGGRHLPRWETVADFVRACGADPEDWREPWEATRAEVGAPSGAAPEPGWRREPEPEPSGVEPSGVEPSGAEPSGVVPEPRRESGRTGRRLLVGAVALAVGIVLLGGAFVVGQRSAGSDGSPYVRAVEVQNKVALGADRLVEDRTPAYLSSLPIAYCALPDRACKVAGTEMGSGAAVVANCVTSGQQMWNYDLAEDAARGNPDRASSDRWYRVSFPDGRSGFISEVYLLPSSRGGQGLPDCGPPGS